MHNLCTTLSLRRVPCSLTNKTKYLNSKRRLTWKMWQLNCPQVALSTNQPVKVIYCRDSRSGGSLSRIYDTQSSSRPGVMQKSLKLKHALYYSFNNISSRSPMQERDKRNGNFLFHNNHTRLCRQFTTETSTVPQDQIMNVFSQTNKHRVIKYVQGMQQYPTLTSGCKRQAGVLVPFCVVDGKPSVLFTVRSTNLVTNRGDVSTPQTHNSVGTMIPSYHGHWTVSAGTVLPCFPGGMRDADDIDIIQTAVRETQEELGLARVHTEVWASLPPMPDRLGKIAVTPVLGFIQNLDISSLQLNPDEVDSVFTLTMDHLCNADNQRYTRFKHGVVFPAFVNGPARVWGLTAIILDRTLAILFPDAHRVNFRFQNIRNKVKKVK